MTIIGRRSTITTARVPPLTQALGQYDWEVHRHYHGNLTYLTSTKDHPVPKLLAYHPDVIRAVQPLTVTALVDMSLQLAKVRQGG